MLGQGNTVCGLIPGCAYFACLLFLLCRNEGKHAGIEMISECLDPIACKAKTGKTIAREVQKRECAIAG